MTDPTLRAVQKISSGSMDRQQGAIRVCSAKNPRIAQYDFMFFGVTRPETRPGTKAGGSRFHQCPSAARAG